ncbi:flagellar filament capping protein FliD [Luteimonas sp. SMYT11W]|uniref:Flagellar hook-associated protein 2 n=1 Tax=Luteimonas flava TaxID=3115822 RepID=A0ABU7WJ77_9GAMM
MALGVVGSGIDPTTTAKQLVASERAPADARFAKTETKIKAEVSAIGSLRSAMSNLQSALRTLSGTQTSMARTVGLSANTAFAATASGGAPTGQYQVEVLALASAQKQSSAALASDKTVVGTGTLAIGAGEHQFSIELADGKNTLADLRDAINTAAAGKGVQAAIITGDDGAHLVLTALDSGTSKAITLDASGGDGDLQALVSGMSEIAPAQDALVKVDGITRTSASNTLTDLVPGVSFTLKKAAPGEPVQMTVSNDSAAQLSGVKAFVEKFNAALYAVASATNYNATTKVAAALNGDAMVRGMSRELRDMIGGDVIALKELGITIGKDGTLTLNEANFNAGLAKDPTAVGTIFGAGDASLGTRMGTSMTAILDSNGPLKTRDESLTQRTKVLTQQRDALDRRMSLAEARYKAQFIALDTLVTKLQSSSNFLTQQLSSSTSAS